jgi:hypothetical protein
MKALDEWQQLNPDELDAPFIDPEELNDPQVREWRETLRRKCGFHKNKNS